MDTSDYLKEALREAHLRQIEDHYANLGFNSLSNYPPFDKILFNSNTGKKIAFIIRFHPISQEESQKLSNLKEESAKSGMEMKLVTLVEPVARYIDIDWLDVAISLYLMEHFPSELDCLSTHTRIDEVSSEILSLDMSDSGVLVSVEGDIGVSLQYGSDSDVDRDI